MVQEFINKQFYNLFLITLLFGVILYNPIGIESVDELCASLLLILFLYSVFKSSNWAFNKMFLFALFVFLFYVFYSIYIGSNTKRGILTDLIIQMKPYLAFFATYHLKPAFDYKQKKLLKDITIILWLCLLPIGLAGFYNEHLISLIMKHTTYYAAAIVSLSLVYLFCSDYTLKDKIIFLLMLSIAVSSGRSKIYGFVALAAVIVLYFGNISNVKFSLKNILILLGTIFLIVFVAWEKVELYFVQNLVDSGSEDNQRDLLARFVLYATSIDIFKDYFPFGSGLASFATHASGAYYSDIYVQYGIEKVWGISKTEWDFIADTYYPSLAQFGIVGVFLYFLFWFHIIRKTFLYFLKSKIAKYFVISLLITGYILIENIADASFTSNRGFFMMMLLGLIMSELQLKELENSQNL
jgi:hypothetical protein